MNAYVYQAALLCESCAKIILHDLDQTGARPSNPEDESSFDSDNYPKGPYPDGGGESDSRNVWHVSQCAGETRKAMRPDTHKHSFGHLLDIFKSL